MTDDRDLIAEGRRLAILQAMEDQAREAQQWLQKVQLSPDLLLELIELAKAAQRPPLGYVVGFEGVDGPELWATRREIHHDEDVARVVLADMRQEEPCMDFQLYEVREVSGE